MKRIILSFLLVISSNAFALEELSNQTEVSRIISYTIYGNGDIGIELSDTSNKTCQGYWFNKDDKAFSASLSMLIAAYQTNTIIAVYGETTNTWAATGSVFCRLVMIDYI